MSIAEFGRTNLRNNTRLRSKYRREFLPIKYYGMKDYFTSGELPLKLRRAAIRKGNVRMIKELVIFFIGLAILYALFVILDFDIILFFGST